MRVVLRTLRTLFLGMSLLGSACGPAPLPTCQTQLADLFPSPRVVEQRSEGRLPTRVCLDATQHPGLTDALTARLGAAGLEVATSDCHWRIELRSDPPTLDSPEAAVWAAGSKSQERHAIVTALRDGRLHTSIHQTDADGAFWAVRDLLALRHTSHGCVAEGVLVDYPSFAVRGVVESFDGGIYTPTDRLSLLELAGELRLNRWLYGPKADHYTHELWADLYPAAEAQVIKDAAAAAEQQHIRFGWAISPGISNWDEPPAYSIKYSSEEDLARLLAKLAQVRSLGVRDFALFLDDVRSELAWDEDRAAFADLPAAQISLVNRLADALRTSAPDAKLIFVGTWFTDAFPGWQDYVTRVGAGIPADVEFFWTGPMVVSETLAPSDLQDVNTHLGRRVLIWDNFPPTPVPFTGRAPTLYEATTGLYSNPVVNELGRYSTRDYANVLGTVGDYLWNSVAFEGETSWARWTSRLNSR